MSNEEKKIALTDESVETVSGGNASNAGKTEMHCTNCKKVAYWNGNYMSGRYDCSHCGGIQSVYGYMYYPDGL